MAGFNRDLILQGVRDELERATHTQDRLFDKALAEWNLSRRQQEKARDEVHDAIAGASDALQTKTPDFARVATLLDSIARYSNSLSTAARELPAMPQRKRSHRERALENVIKIIESHSEPTVTISDLRALGVLEYVRVPKDVC